MLLLLMMMMMLMMAMMMMRRGHVSAYVAPYHVHDACNQPSLVPSSLLW